MQKWMKPSKIKSLDGKKKRKAFNYSLPIMNVNELQLNPLGKTIISLLISFW